MWLREGIGSLVMRECFRVESYLTDVMGIAAWPDRPVGRCIGISDASLSLSLSLSCPGSAPGLNSESRRPVDPLMGRDKAVPSPVVDASAWENSLDDDLAFLRVEFEQDAPVAHAQARFGTPLELAQRPDVGVVGEVPKCREDPRAEGRIESRDVFFGTPGVAKDPAARMLATPQVGLFEACSDGSVRGVCVDGAIR
jgi:hypothetical protein